MTMRDKPPRIWTTSFFPLSWCDCDICRRQWKWARGWRTIEDHSTWAGIRVRGYFCPACAPDHATAEKLATDHKWIFARYPRPTPPASNSRTPPPPPDGPPVRMVRDTQEFPPCQ